MLKTIMLGSYISIQGTFVRALSNGLVVVRVGSQNFVGTPIGKNTA